MRSMGANESPRRWRTGPSRVASRGAPMKPTQRPMRLETTNHSGGEAARASCATSDERPNTDAVSATDAVERISPTTKPAKASKNQRTPSATLSLSAMMPGAAGASGSGSDISTTIPSHLPLTDRARRIAGATLRLAWSRGNPRAEAGAAEQVEEPARQGRRPELALDLVDHRRGGDPDHRHPVTTAALERQVALVLAVPKRSQCPQGQDRDLRQHLRFHLGDLVERDEVHLDGLQPTAAERYQQGASGWRRGQRRHPIEHAGDLAPLHLLHRHLRRHDDLRRAPSSRPDEWHHVGRSVQGQAVQRGPANHHVRRCCWLPGGEA